MPAEKHREGEWDLREYHPESQIGWRFPLLEHVNLALDKAIVADRSKRGSLEELITACSTARHKIKQGLNAIAPNNPIVCIICGDGRYVIQTRHEAKLMGNTQIMLVHEWRVFACSNCGHAQWFRVDLAASKWLWKEIK